MKHLFILDENVICQTRDLALAIQTLELFNRMKKNCHRMVLDAVIQQKLYTWMKRRDKAFSNFFPNGPTHIRAILTDSRKGEWVATQPNQKERVYIRDQDDWFLVDLAVSCGKPLHYVSTGDSSTRGGFNRPEFKAIGIDGITVAEALILALDS